MKYDLIIDSRPSEVVIALLRDGLLIELHKEKHDNNFSVGDIYLGKVRKTAPGLNASFVNIGYEKDGFLHYLDLGPQFKSFKKFSMQKCFPINWHLMEQFEIPDNSFVIQGKSHNVPCVFQIWEKRDENKSVAILFQGKIEVFVI